MSSQSTEYYVSKNVQSQDLSQGSSRLLKLNCSAGMDQLSQRRKQQRENDGSVHNDFIRYTPLCYYLQTPRLNWYWNTSLDTTTHRPAADYSLT